MNKPFEIIVKTLRRFSHPLSSKFQDDWVDQIERVNEASNRVVSVVARMSSDEIIIRATDDLGNFNGNNNS